MRRKLRLAASAGDLVEGDERRPQHDRVAVVVDAAPPGPPGELGVLARGEELVALAGELGQLLDHHGAGRHVDAEGEGLGGEHDLDESLDEAGLDRLLERRHHAGVVGGDARLEAGEPPVVAEEREVVVAEVGDVALDDLADADALVGAR